jgi:hypothetical protein
LPIDRSTTLTASRDPEARMHPDRRTFLERLALGGAVVAGMDLTTTMPSLAAAAEAPAGQEPQWDVSWVAKVNRKHKCVFDCTEIEDGAGFLRSMLWTSQYATTLGVKPRDMSAVVVIRHSAIPLAMTQEFWDKYDIGKTKGVKNFMTDEPTNRNPVLLSAEKGELPPAFARFNLTGLFESGGIALACNLAFAECVRTVAKADGVEQPEARKRALEMLLPGVILQPSGVFASIRAQEAGCVYLKAS